jgi:hypothetical protein
MTSRPKRVGDPNQPDKSIIDMATGQKADPTPEAQASDGLRQMLMLFPLPASR